MKIDGKKQTDGSIELSVHLGHKKKKHPPCTRVAFFGSKSEYCVTCTKSTGPVGLPETIEAYGDVHAHAIAFRENAEPIAFSQAHVASNLIHFQHENVICDAFPSRASARFEKDGGIMLASEPTALVADKEAYGFRRRRSGCTGPLGSIALHWSRRSNRWNFDLSRLRQNPPKVITQGERGVPNAQGNVLLRRHLRRV